MRRLTEPVVVEVADVAGEAAREEEGEGEMSHRWISAFGLRGMGAWISDKSESIERVLTVLVFLRRVGTLEVNEDVDVGRDLCGRLVGDEGSWN